MKYANYGNVIVCRIDRGEEIMQKLAEVVAAEGITVASVSAIGAVDEFSAGIYDLQTKEYLSRKYEGSYEIVSLTGNVTQKEGKPYLHLHIACSDGSGAVVGGHMTMARVSVTSEAFIYPVAAKIERIADEVTKINVMDLG